MKAKDIAYAALFAALLTLGDVISFYNVQLVTTIMVVCAAYCGARVLLAATGVYAVIDVVMGIGMYWALVPGWISAALTVVLVLHVFPRAYGVASGLSFLTFSLTDALLAHLVLGFPLIPYLVAGTFFVIRGVVSGFVLGAVLVRILLKRSKEACREEHFGSQSH